VPWLSSTTGWSVNCSNNVKLTSTSAQQNPLSNTVKQNHGRKSVVSMRIK
jgi:invasion protein IalB